MDARIMSRLLLDAVPRAETVLMFTVCVGVGWALGLLHFRGMRIGVGLLLAGRRPVVVAGLWIVRLALLAVALTGFARWGALPLLAATGGILAARNHVLRLAAREAP
jgi:hypothetical protein